MATHPPGLDPRAVIEDRPPGRPRAGYIVAIIIALGCGIVVLGADLLQSIASPERSAVPFIIALLLALLPVPLLLALVLLLDRLEPEPTRNLVLAFAWGAGIAALLAALINTAGLLFITQPELGTTTGAYISATFGAPVVEETLKGLVLVGLLRWRRAELDGPTDGIIYAAMVGLGFAMTENIGYYIEALVQPMAGGSELLGVTFVFRGLLGAFAHPAFTAMTGLGAAYVATHRHRGWALPAGLLAAMILHGVWNGLAVLGLAGIGIAYLLVACVLAGLLLVVIADRRRIVGLIWRFLPAYIPTGVVTDADLRMLSTLHTRRAARRWARTHAGGRGATAMADYQVAATELALAHQRQERGLVDAARFEQRRSALLGLMSAARDTFLAHQPGPRHPPWAQPGQSGFGGHDRLPGGGGLSGG